MARLAIEYGRLVVESSFSALLELSLVLRAYSESLVLVGGWVPYFLLRDHRSKDSDFEHVGSIDADLIVDPDRIGSVEYATIAETLRRRGWTPSPRSIFSFTKRIPSQLDSIAHEIKVDFLTPAPPRLQRKRQRHARVQHDLAARTMRGARIALEHRTRVPIEGRLPEGGRVRSDILMADVVGFVTTKGLALGERYAEKDAYDLVAVIENLEGGPEDVAASVRPFLSDPLVAEGMGSIRQMFTDERSAGPIWFANFLTERRDTTHSMLVSRAFIVVSRFLDALDR